MTRRLTAIVAVCLIVIFGLALVVGVADAATLRHDVDRDVDRDVRAIEHDLSPHTARVDVASDTVRS